MKKNHLILFLLIILSPFSYSQDEASHIELAKVIQTNGAKSQAKIFIAPKSKINPKLRNEFSANETVIIDALVKPASYDIGKQIEIFVVIRKQLGSKKTFYALDEDGIWVLWNGSLKSLPIYESIESASDKHEFRVYDGSLESDEFNMYLGYSSETVDEKPVIHVNLTPYKISAFENSIFNAELGLVFDSQPDIEIKNPTAQLGLDHCTLSYFENLVVLDINMDGSDDILFTLLCGTVDQLPEWSDPNTPHFDPVPNALIAIASQPDGTYKVDNEKIFGKNKVTLGSEPGGIISFVRPLENPTPGTPPIISYVVNRDDHQRLHADVYSNNWASQGVLVPDENEIYKINDLGNGDYWAATVAGIPNSDYTWDIVHSTMGWANWRDKRPFVYRQNLGFNQGWEDVSDEYQDNDIKELMTSTMYTFTNNISNPTTFGEEMSLDADVLFQGDGAVLRMYKLNNGYPSLYAEIEVGNFTNMLQIAENDRNNWCGARNVFKYEGNYYLGWAWDHFELWRPNPSSEPLLLAFAATNYITDPDNFDENNPSCTVGEDNTDATVAFTFSFNNGLLELVDAGFETVIQPAAGNMKGVRDFNGDGFDDYFTAGGSGHWDGPHVYINDQRGSLVEINTRDFLPENTPYRVKLGPGTYDHFDINMREMFWDVNNDGVIDLIQYNEGPGAQLQNWVKEKFTDTLDNFEHESGYIKVWYGKNE